MSQTATTSPHLTFERDGRVGTLTLERPPLNILDLATLRELDATLARLEEAELQVLTLRSGIERGFSAGVAVEDHVPEKVGEMLSVFHRGLERLATLPAITVAVVHGHCLGGGMELAMSCDLVLAAEDARFGQPEVELGCYPPYAAALYPRLIGPRRTLEMLLTGRSFPAAEAEAMGLVNDCVPREALEASLETLVAAITAKSAAVTPLIKQAVRAARGGSFDEALAESERLYNDELTQTADMQEGLTAFLEKRKPSWKHR